jgi:hypothetical protein
MAKLKVSELPVATGANPNDLVYLVQSNTSKSISIQNLLNRISGNLTITGRITANAFLLPSYTSNQANALSVANGTMIYNSQTGKFQGYANGVWVALH